MSSKSNDVGRAFEYACIIKLKDRISNYRPVQINEQSVTSAKRAWEVVDNFQQNILSKAASAFIDTLFKAEPLILECDNETDIVELSINKDLDAEEGDVRDIVITRGQIQWDVGLSMKHNHFAAKHSRLSPSIDFGLKWYNRPCDKSYWDAILPIFLKLKDLKSKQKKWSEINDKAENIYVPVLTAFSNELMRAYKQDKTLPTRLLSYLLGERDFYKVVAVDNRKITEFQSFNLRGELNKDGKRTKATLFIPVAALPDEIILMRMKPCSTNTVELYLNNGWTLSFRIHNASTIVEPSLKFDIQFVGVPSNIITINCTWQ